jgi:phosphohistidine phosphatase SixA
MRLANGLACALSILALGLALGLAGTSVTADADDAAWAALSKPGTFAVLRHALAPGTGDPQGFEIGDCSTQRNLSEAGRTQARLIGEAFAARGIVVDRILTSQWCRCRDTASGMAAAMGDVPVDDFPALNSFFRDRSTEPAQTAAVLERLRTTADAHKLVLVSHFVNVRALTGIGTSSGEIVVFRLDEDGAVDPLGEILIPAPD